MDVNFLFVTSFWIVSAFFTFLISLFVTAPFGRHTSTQWGTLISNKIGWFVMELPALLVFPLFYLIFLYRISSSSINISMIIILSLWVIHYFNRVAIFPFRLKTKKKKMPLLIAAFAFIFNLINGLLLGWDFAFVNPIKNEIYLNSHFIIGVFIFFLGMIINWTSDSHLISLRKNDTAYSIPHKGIFRWVSCPNHLGEIIEWIGFAICTWHYSALAFAIWTFANLSPRSWAHHKWYRKHFKNEYPKDRKAVIPFIW